MWLLFVGALFAQSAPCPSPCGGMQGALRLELLGGASSLADAVTSVAVLAPSVSSGAKPERSGMDGIMVFPLGMIGPVLIDAAGQRYRGMSVARGGAGRAGVGRWVGVATLGVGGVVGLTGGVMSLTGDRAGPWLQLASVPILLGSAGAFVAESRRSAGALAVESPVTLAAPALWVGPDGGGLMVQGSW